MAQTVATTPRHHFYQNNGELAAGGTLEIFDANTITHAVTWFERDGLAIHQNANPLTLDSQGAAVVWLEAGKVYDWVARDSLGNIIDNAKGITGSTSAVAALSQWVVTGLIPTFVSSRTFTLIGNQTAVYETGRRVRVTLSGGFKYATVISSVFSTVTTVTLAFSNGSDVLDATLSAVDVGLDVASSPSAQIGIGSIIDLTGYTGADIPLAVGQTAIYTVSSLVLLALRISTANNQSYTLDISINHQFNNNAAQTFLIPNNATVSNISSLALNVTSTPTTLPAFSGGLTAFVLNVANNPIRITADIKTNIFSKTVFSRSLSASATIYSSAFHDNLWVDTVTAWTSLGTLDFTFAQSGIVSVRRNY